MQDNVDYTFMKRRLQAILQTAIINWDESNTIYVEADEIDQFLLAAHYVDGTINASETL